MYATPIRKGECRVFARFPFKFSSKVPGFFIKLTPRWYSHIGNNNILEDDQIFLHYQERYLEAKGGGSQFAKAFYLPTRADAFVAELRKWVNQFQADPFPGEQLPIARSTETLLDRYHSHTEHCASCRNALANLQKIRASLAVGGAIAWAILPLVALNQPPSLSSTPLLPMLSAVVPLVAGSVWYGLGKLERRFYEGRRVPPRNLPENRSPGNS